MKFRFGSLLAFLFASFSLASTHAQGTTSPAMDSEPGGLRADQIRDVIRSNLPDVEQCYEEGLRRRPSLTGRVVIAYIISADGTVRSSEVANSTVGDPEMEACIARACATWVYPRPDPPGIVSVRFPFTLSQTEEAPPRPPRERATRLFARLAPPHLPTGEPRAIRALERELRSLNRRFRLARPDARLALMFAYAEVHAAYQVALDARVRTLSEARRAACSPESSSPRRCGWASDDLREATAALDQEIAAGNALLAATIRDHPDGPTLDRTMFALGYGLGQLTQIDRAHRVYLALAERYPSSRFVAYAFAAIGDFCFDQGMTDSATVGFERALRASGATPATNAYAHAMLGLLRRANAEDRAALASFDAASTLLSDQPNLLSAFAPNDRRTFESVVHTQTAELLVSVGTQGERNAARTRWSRSDSSEAMRRALVLLDAGR